ncbi:Flp family type IVb pilin [Altererythrobacter sp. JGD-16]|uniref:Flp family type IVb pilin n=2 Tax=Altererythrobacter lutimaris TaxID=2743979 RepID=A0A850H3U8_9SPHN|nr:Flp family type IVb pilin [Altererythrobacter lutimaris]
MCKPRIFSDESGATAIEYGLICALIAISAIVALGAVGDELSTTMSTVSTEMGANNTVTP